MHHRMWDESRNTHLFTRGNLDEAQYLINAVAELNLQMGLPKDLILCALLTELHKARQCVHVQLTMQSYGVL